MPAVVIIKYPSMLLPLRQAKLIICDEPAGNPLSNGDGGVQPGTANIMRGIKAFRRISGHEVSFSFGSDDVTRRLCPERSPIRLSKIARSGFCIRHSPNHLARDDSQTLQQCRCRMHQWNATDRSIGEDMHSRFCALRQPLQRVSSSCPGWATAQRRGVANLSEDFFRASNRRSHGGTPPDPCSVARL